MVLKRARRESHFSQIPNRTLRDTQLSDGAYRLLMYMLSMSDEWVFYNSVMAKAMKVNEKTIRRRITELQSAGYIVRSRKRNIDGKFSTYDTTVYETPQPVDNIGVPVNTAKSRITSGQFTGTRELSN